LTGTGREPGLDNLMFQCRFTEAAVAEPDVEPVSAGGDKNSVRTS
jgi:hypothetical protein